MYRSQNLAAFKSSQNGLLIATGAAHETNHGSGELLIFCPKAILSKTRVAANPATGCYLIVVEEMRGSWLTTEERSENETNDARTFVEDPYTYNRS